MYLLFYIFSQYYILTFETPVVKCGHGIQVNWSQYRDTGVTVLALLQGDNKIRMFLLSSFISVQS